MEQTVETVQNEIVDFAGAVLVEVTNQDESLVVQARVVEIRKEQKKRSKWFTDEILVHSKKAHDETKAAFDAQKAVLVKLLKPLADWDKQAIGNVRAFELAERQRRAKEQELELKKYAKRQENAEAKGKDLDSVKPLKVLSPVANTQKSESGSFTFRIEKHVEIVNESEIPDAYFDHILSMQRIGAALRAGLKVPGAILVEELGSSVRTA